MSRKTSFRDSLLELPNVGTATAEDLNNIGIYRIEDMKGMDPEKLYAKLEKFEGRHVDRCMLYVMRSLVYMAESGERNPSKVAWWYFQDSKLVKKGKK